MNNGWIPVSERLPQNYRNCWVTVYVCGGTPFVKRDCYYNGEWEQTLNEFVIAWQYMDTPLPYQPEDE